MSKNEAVNTFNGGLVMDLNPISTPNNVLTNCLNGTLITYNGNEYTLQSDMGNGRVETAYLPAGYVPVGIKEHGGIIYVASHNPITGKSLIGSFPSPERNISSEELNDSDARIDFSKFADNLVLRIKLFGEETIIRSGDKFSIIMIPNISGTSSDLKKLLSNYLNILNGKVKCLKNKLITLDVAVLDSNNNLHSITNTLKRFDLSTNLEIKDSYKLAQDVKVNTEYFTQTFSTKLNVSSSDSIDKFRNIKARNTFNSKLIGNLCIIATLNTVSQFEFSIGGTVEGENTRLYLDSAFEYNCPDGRYNGSSTYGSASDFDPDNSIVGYDVTFENERVLERKNFLTSNINFDSDVYDETHSCTKYNKENNLYISKLLDTYVILKKSGIVYYTATPISIVGPLNGLSISGQIDLDKIGSGEMSITHWRYYKNEDYVSLLWGLEYYPKYKEAIIDMRFSFYDIYSSDFNTPTYTYSIDKKRNYNGVFTELLHLPEWDGVKNKLFLVKIEYKLNTQNEFQVLDYRWLFNTRLYNEAYAKGEILDFGNWELFQVHLLLYSNLSIVLSVEKNMTRSIPTYLTNVKLEDNYTIYTKKSIFNYLFEPLALILIENIEYYPITGEINPKDGKDLVKYNLSVKDCNTYSIPIIGTDTTKLVTINNYESEDNFSLIINLEQKTLELSFSGKLAYIPEETVVSIKKIYTPICPDLETIAGETTDSFPSTTCVLMSSSRKLKAFSRDDHYIRFYTSCDINSTDLRDCWDKGIEVFNTGSDSVVNVDLLSFISSMLNELKNSSTLINTLSSFGYKSGASSNTSWNPSGVTAKNQVVETILTNSNMTTKYLTAFWKNVDGIPLLLDCYVSKGQSISKILVDIFKNYYKYNSYYSGGITSSIPWLKDKYGYNENYNIVTNINLNALYEIKVDTSAYNKAIESCISYFNIEDENFKLMVHIKDEYSGELENLIELNLEIEGLSEIFSLLKSLEVENALGYFINSGSQFKVLYTPTNLLDTNRTYFYKENISQEPELMSQQFDQRFIENNGKFYIRNRGNKKISKNIYINSGERNPTLIRFKNTEIIDLKSLIGDNLELNYW